MSAFYTSYSYTGGADKTKLVCCRLCDLSQSGESGRQVDKQTDKLRERGVERW